MPATFNIEIKGFENVTNLFASINESLSPAQVRNILAEPAKEIIKKAKADTRFKGSIGEEFKADLGVWRSRANRGAQWVYAGTKFKRVIQSGVNEEKAAVVAAHMSEGFKQTSRRGRGRVRIRYSNPVLQAWSESKNTVDDGIRKGIVKVVDRLKKKYNA